MLFSESKDDLREYAKKKKKSTRYPAAGRSICLPFRPEFRAEFRGL
jgi:hypothetical protein